MTPQELIENSTAIAITLPTQATNEERRIAAALYCALKNTGKKIVLRGLAAPDKERLSAEAPASPREKTFAVSITGLAPWISQVSYEQDDSDLKIYFTLKDRSSQNWDSSNALQGTDQLTIIVGENAPQDNKQHVLEETKPAIYATNAVRDFSFILLSQDNQPERRLLGRVLVNLECIESLNLYVSMLTQKNFEGAKSSSKSLQYVLDELRHSFGEDSSFLLLFESLQSQVSGLLWSPHQDIQDKVLLYGSGEGKGNWVLFTLSKKDLHTVKEDILRTLRL